MVRVTVAGRVGVEAEGVLTGEAGLGRLGRLALAYLVCERHRPVTRDELADVLWGEHVPASWEQLLRGLASKMRVTFGRAGLDPTHTLRTGLGSYQIHLPPDAVVDVEEAADDLEAAATALAGADPAMARKRASAVIAVAARQFLPGATGTWVERRQAELRELHLRALEVVARASTADGLWGEAIGASEDAIAIEPFRESAYLALMEAHAGAGSRGEAVRAYERCRRVLAEELGVPPSAATEAAFLALLGEEPASTPADSSPAAVLPLPPALLAPTGGFVVGREADAERLAAALQRTLVEGRQAVFVGGEPGIGKTTLVAAFARDAHRQGARVLYGRCDEGLGLSYQPFAEALTGFVANAPEAELATHVAAHGGELARLAPELARRLPDTPAPSVTDPETDRFRLFDAITALLGAAAERAPIVLILDDLHWAATPSLVLLRQLLRAMNTLPLLLVGTYRHTDIGPDHPLTQTLADLHREPAVDRLVLGGLDEDGVAAFLDAATADHDGADLAPARALHAHTAGNPFFVGQLLRHLGETGATFRRDGSWSYYADIDDLGIPEGIRAVVARRLQRLSEPGRESLRWASLIGSEFALDLLERVDASHDGEALLDAVEEAVHAQLVVEVRPGDYAFVHALVRDTIYGELSRTRRAHRHRRIAEALESLSVDDALRLPALAHHFAAAATAGGATKAADYAMAAARQAFAQSAWEDAVAFLERGLEALGAGDPPDLERRCDLLLMLAETWCRFWDIDRARPFATEAVATARALGDAERMAMAARWYLTAQRRPEPAIIEIAEEALAGLGEDRPDVRAMLLARLSPIKGFPPGMTSNALELARRSGSREALGVTLLVRSVDLAGTGQAQQRLAVAEELVTRAPPDGWDGWRGGFEQRAAARITLGDRTGFEADAAECERMGSERRYWFYRASAAVFRGTSALLDGRFDEVEALAEEARALRMAVTGTRVPHDLTTIQLARLALDRGQPQKAEEILLAALEQLPGHGVLAPMLAVVHAERGDVDGAVREFDRHARTGFRTTLARVLPASLAYLAEVAAALADDDRAAQVYDRFLPFSGLMVAAGAVAHCPGAADRYLGQLAATMGRLDEAEAHYDEALRMEEVMRAPPLLARTRLAYARMLWDRDGPADAARARQLLEKSLDAADRLGMAGVAHDARELLHRL